jgi:hypothetical protein
MRTCETMINAHPQPPVIDGAVLCAAIERLLDCGQACAVCADACLAEADALALTPIIRAAQDCADLCQVAARLASRQQPAEVVLLARILELAALAGDLCADLCEPHAATHPHCRACAEICRLCEDACQKALHSMPGAATRPVIPSMTH